MYDRSKHFKEAFDDFICIAKDNNLVKSDYFAYVDQPDDILDAFNIHGKAYSYNMYSSSNSVSGNNKISDSDNTVGAYDRGDGLTVVDDQGRLVYGGNLLITTPNSVGECVDNSFKVKYGENVREQSCTRFVSNIIGNNPQKECASGSFSIDYYTKDLFSKLQSRVFQLLHASLSLKEAYVFSATFFKILSWCWQSIQNFNRY